MLAPAPQLLAYDGADFLRVPEEAVVRHHDRMHVADCANDLLQMASGRVRAWPFAPLIGPAAIVVLEVRSGVFEWHLPVVVRGREHTEDGRILLRMPKKTCREMLRFMRSDDQLCESSLVTKYAPANGTGGAGATGWAPSSYRDDALAAVHHDAAALERVATTLLDDHEVVLAAARQVGLRALDIASFRLAHDPELKTWTQLAPAERARRRLRENLMLKATVYWWMEAVAKRHELARIERARRGEVDDPLA